MDGSLAVTQAGQLHEDLFVKSDSDWRRMSPDEVGMKIEWQDAESGCVTAYTRDGREVFLHAPYQKRGNFIPIRVKIVAVRSVSETPGEPVWKRLRLYLLDAYGLDLQTEDDVLAAVRRA